MTFRSLGACYRTVMALFLLLSTSGAYAAEPMPATTDAARVLSTARLLAASHDAQTGLFQGTGWWNSANGITAIADASRVLHTREFDPLMADTWKVAEQQHPNFLNEFYDDEGWWALAWLDVYRLRGDARYLHSAEVIFTDMSGGWSDTCGGGIWWKKNEHYKNAIANELFLSLAAQLAQATQGREQAGYLQWATKEAQWFLHSGMINSEHLVNDGLDASCKNNGRTTWTYNQGVLIGGLATLGQLTQIQSYRDIAGEVAHAAATRLVDAQGVVHDPCEPNCGADGVQFKGVLMRNLPALLRVSPTPELDKFVQTNADSIWKHARTPEGYISVNWSGPAVNGGTGALISGLDTLTAALALHAAAASPSQHAQSRQP